MSTPSFVNGVVSDSPLMDLWTLRVLLYGVRRKGTEGRVKGGE